MKKRRKYRPIFSLEETLKSEEGIQQRQQFPISDPTKEKKKRSPTISWVHPLPPHFLSSQEIQPSCNKSSAARFHSHNYFEVGGVSTVEWECWVLVGSSIPSPCNMYVLSPTSLSPSSSYFSLFWRLMHTLNCVVNVYTVTLIFLDPECCLLAFSRFFSAPSSAGGYVYSVLPLHGQRSIARNK